MMCDYEDLMVTDNDPVKYLVAMVEEEISIASTRKSPSPPGKHLNTTSSLPLSDPLSIM